MATTFPFPEVVKLNTLKFQKRNPPQLFAVRSAAMRKKTPSEIMHKARVPTRRPKTERPQKS
jgi:hypothetical protein